MLILYNFFFKLLKLKKISTAGVEPATARYQLILQSHALPLSYVELLVYTNTIFI